MRAIGDHIYLGDGVAGFYVLDRKIAYQLESSYSSLTSTSTNQGNRGLDKDDRYIYMADHQRGMRVYTATPNELKAVSSYTGGKGNSTVDVAVNRGVAYIASNKDFTAVDVSQPEAQINLLDSLVPPDVEETYSVIVDDHFAYLTLGETGLAVIDVTDPANLGLPIVEKLPSDRSAMGLDALGSHVYIASQSPGAEGRGGLDVVSVVDPTIPSSLGYVSLPGDPLNVDAITFLDGLYGVDPATPGARIYIYIATGRAGVQLVDASDVNNLVLLQLADLFPTGTRVVDVFTTGNRLYAIGITPTNSGVFYAFGAVSPDNLQIIGQPLDLIGLPSRLIVEGEFAYITTQGHGLQVVKIDPEGNHNIIPSYTPSSAAKWLTLQTLEGTDGAVADQPVELKTYIYVVDGYKNLRILELNRTGAVKETGSFDQLTAAQHIVVQGNFAYIADGIGGIRILSVQDRTMPISMAQLFEPVGAQYIAVHGNYAYVASGFGGLWVVDISDPLAPKAVKNVPFNCEANLVGVNRGDHLLLGCRGVGLISLRLVDPINPQYVSAYTQYADIEALMLVGNYAFLSLGESGLVVLDVTNPEDMQVVSHYPSDGETRNVMYADLVKSIVFLSIQDGGIEMVDFKDLNNPALLSIYFIEGFSAEMIQALWIPPEAGGGGQGYFGIFVAAGEKGLEIHTATMSVAIDFLGMYETPGSATPAMVLHNLGVRAGRGGQLVNDVLYKKGTWTMWRVPFEFVIIGGLGLLIWMALFAQHVLPVESLDERKQAIRQLRAYLFGNQSLIVRTRDGSVLEPERLVKTKPSGSGVALVDLSSAIVLYGRSWLSPRPKGQGWFAGLMRSIAGGQPVNNGDKREKESLPHPRVVGPGLVFTEPGEFMGVSPYDKDVFDIADLHPQVRIDKNVCTATQDGIEVKTDVFCIFNLGEAPDVLRVTYEDSSSEPDKIRVVYAEEGSKKDAHGKRVHGLRVKKLVDELDGDDKFEIHRYIQDAKKKGQQVESIDLYSTEPYLKFQKPSTMDTPDITGLIEILEGRYKLDPYDNNKYWMHLYFLINELIRDFQFDKQKIAKYIPPIQLLFDYPSRIYKPETKRNHNFIRLIGELIELRKDNKHLVRDKNNNTIKGKLDLYKVNQKRANLVQMNITNSVIKDIRDWVEKLDGDIKRACIEYLLSPYGYNEERSSQRWRQGRSKMIMENWLSGRSCPRWWRQISCGTW